LSPWTCPSWYCLIVWIDYTTEDHVGFYRGKFTNVTQNNIKFIKNNFQKLYHSRWGKAYNNKNGLICDFLPSRLTPHTLPSIWPFLFSNKQVWHAAAAAAAGLLLSKVLILKMQLFNIWLWFVNKKIIFENVGFCITFHKICIKKSISLLDFFFFKSDKWDNLFIYPYVIPCYVTFSWKTAGNILLDSIGYCTTQSLVNSSQPWLRVHYLHTLVCLVVY
jgi:hypothetical protein